jgi:hypothetical protein
VSTFSGLAGFQQIHSIGSSERKEAVMDKKITEYQTPQIEDHGDLAELTAGKNHGIALDAGFQTGTPLEDVTLTTP